MRILRSMDPSLVTASELLQVDAASIQALATVKAAWIQGSMTLFAGLFAVLAGWFSLNGAKHQAKAQFASTERQIIAAADAEKKRVREKRGAIFAAFRAELSLYSDPIVSVTSRANSDSRVDRTGKASLPMLAKPMIYERFVGEIGLLQDEKAAKWVLSFYGNLIFLNDCSAGMGISYSNGHVADKLRVLSENLANALDCFFSSEELSVNNIGVDLDALWLPSGEAASTFHRSPVTMQDLLRLVASGSFGDP